MRRTVSVRRVCSRRVVSPLFALLALAGFATLARAQGNYEIQVYGSETVSPGATMVELHSNYSIKGQSYVVDGVYPTRHQLRETVEITHGINNWSEIGFYIFTAAQSTYGYNWVGDHIRPRVRVPPSWHWPVGVSLSTEFGYQRAVFSPDTWTWEIRPIVDKELGRWYLSLNPALERTIHGPSADDGFGFAPGAKVGYDVTPKINVGVEYYGSYGPVRAPDALHNQQQQFFVVSDLNVSPNWEINMGLGIGPTAATDHLIVKGIIGRRFSWRAPRSTD